MKKLVEHTYGTHIFMKMELDNVQIGEIDVYVREDGEHYKTSCDKDIKARQEIINAFNKLY